MEQHQFGLREWADLCERKDATIAALQARVNGLEKDSELLRQSRDDFRVKYESVKNDAITLQSQLTQRTAELERVRLLIKALPKVEGEVTVRDITALCWASDGTYGSINCKEQLVSLLQERQKLC